jgi:hypothetical protein
LSLAEILVELRVRLLVGVVMDETVDDCVVFKLCS